MQSFDGVGPVFRHQHRLVMLRVPCHGLVDHLLRYHVDFTGILIPAIVSIEADNVQEFGLHDHRRYV